MTAAPAPDVPVELPPVLPLVLTEVEAVEVTRLSPSFVRVSFAGPELADVGVDGPWLDQRIKLVLPEEHGRVPALADVGEDWYAAWRALPAEQRGHMRTYTVRDLQGYGADTRLVVDFVVHEDGLAGPGAGWALRARPGMRIVLLAPRRGVPFGGIEFTPGAARSLLLVGDETAVPAVAGILAGLGCGVTGTAFVEVPDALDIQDLPAPPGLEVRWLVRGHRDVGSRLVPAVRKCLGLPASAPGDDHGAPCSASGDRMPRSGGPARDAHRGPRRDPLRADDGCDARGQRPSV